MILQIFREVNLVTRDTFTKHNLSSYHIFQKVFGLIIIFRKPNVVMQLCQDTNQYFSRYTKHYRATWLSITWKAPNALLVFSTSFRVTNATLNPMCGSKLMNM